MRWSAVFVFFCCQLLAASTHFLSDFTHRHLNVPIGRRIYLTQSELGLSYHSNNSTHQCLVELTLGEAISQRVGRFQPEVFGCAFSNRSVYYTHFGSHLLDVDIVRLRVIQNFEPKIQLLELHFHVQRNVPYKTVTVNNHLIVRNFFDVSQPVDDRVLKFSNFCRVIVRISMIGPKWPKYGQLIYGKNRTVLDAPLESSCDEFPYLNLRYEHLSPPTPDVDHIDLIVESPDDHCPICVRREWVQLKVVINGAKSNLAPKLDPHSSPQLKCVEFQPEIVTPKILLAEDNETASTNLIFNVTSKPKNGYFHFVSKSNAPLYSFLQRDIIDHRLAFTGTKVGSENITIDVIDELSLTCKQPIVLSIVTSDNVERQVSIVKGLIVFEGNSTSITTKNIELKASKSTEQPRISFQVVSGPHYGNLTVDRRPIKFFYWYDVEWGSLTYSHDGSDTSADEIMLLVGQHKQRLPIEIVPVDDSSPQLAVNEDLTVGEGQTVVLNADALKAVDPDTPDEQITYQVIRSPQGGYLLKKLLFRSGFIQVTNFTQDEVDTGLIVYTHANAQIFLDEFQIILKESHLPLPNESPVYDVSVVITPLANDPPRPMVTASFRATVKEIDVLHLNRNLMGFINKEAREDDIYYNLTKSPIESGKFVLSTSTGSKKQLEQLPSLMAFSQMQINRRQVVYIPPSNEIGPHLLQTTFNFTVEDGYGNVTPNHQFHVTVLPIDDKRPVIRPKDLTVGQGQKRVISLNYLNVTDDDTEEDDIALQLEVKPLHGTIMFDDSPLALKHPVTLKDFGAERVSYVHRGLNVRSDSFTVSASDGRNQPTTAIIGINVKPANMTVRMVDQTDTSDQMVVSVMEKDLITIPMELLAVEPDPAQTDVRYAVVKSPHHGSVRVRGHQRDTFSQTELANGEVQYIHDGSEIGYQAQLDDIWITVDDGSVRGRSGVDPVHSLRINIIPVDNVAPRIAAALPLQLTEGGSVQITDNNLLIVDDDSAAEHIVLVVAKPPLYGVVMLNGKKTKHFRMNQMTEGRVTYTQTHHRWLEQRWDSMVIYATDGHHRSDSVKIDANITLINDEPPQITVNNFLIEQQATKVLDKSVISVADLDWPPDTITVTLVTPPAFGRLVVNSATASRPISYFTRLSLTDWDKHSVSYIHVAPHLLLDQFTLAVNDGKHQVLATLKINVTEIVTHLKQVGKVVSHTTDRPPTKSTEKTLSKPVEAIKVEITSPETLEEFSDGLYGFILTRHNIIPSYQQQPQQLLFKIVTRPVNGRLENVSSGQKDIASFGLNDLYNEYIRYVILKPRGENDSFSLSVDGSGVTHRVNLEWSIIYLQRSVMKVCEDVGVLSLSVYRSSNLFKPAFVNIRAIPGTATELADYRPSRVKQLQFNSNVSSLTWDISIIDDEPDKDLVETFTVRLSQPVNAIVLPENATSTIQIVDQRKGGCGKGEEANKSAITDTVSNPQECNRRNQGQKLIVNYGTAKIMLVCDGNIWKNN